MRRLLLLLSFIVLIVFTGVGCGVDKGQPNAGAEPVNLTISAAASLQDAARELKEIYTRENPNVTITYNFASSGTLQKQIEEGAPADLFISAGKSQMDALAEKGLIIEDSRKDLLGNDLVLITGNDSSLAGFDELTGDKVAKISIGAPESVPAGKYSQEALDNMGLWDAIQSKLVLAKDVRQVLTYVETGNVDAGLVYHSDALMGKNIKVVTVAPEDSHKPIVYPMAIIKETKHQAETESFANFLSGQEASKVFIKYGFKRLDD
ncbi:molybdate ABC transporter substrate-binding protein [Desulfoscipio gibsoniae]|uniref:Molybdenum ABC transporter, periplasmic molybdate-binding protein n=1 Tax=Desulfoscipio gibsoniae DSM 7213 TaxID=767817 RepID=R4KFG8_9FIRM|nr:molybdate ABC transporter substrate-binding protein [Desulfoscipio gibsoniae]AGL01923.1 molybdenum ABC transporter, periplasmic molybdate-binding protein [Desulfoscipio gibsoniae DSM 7213]